MLMRSNHFVMLTMNRKHHQSADRHWLPSISCRDFISCVKYYCWIVYSVGIILLKTRITSLYLQKHGQLCKKNEYHVGPELYEQSTLSRNKLLEK